VADRCIVDFEIRNVAGDRVEDLLDRLTVEAAALVVSRVARFPQAAIKLERLNEYPGLATQRNSEVVIFMQRLCHEPALFKVAFGTEGGLFSDRLGIPTVICGPGSMDQGHKPDEYVGLDQLSVCDWMLDRLIDQLSG
jgi:acetylornithine deacetylase